MDKSETQNKNLQVYVTQILVTALFNITIVLNTYI